MGMNRRMPGGKDRTMRAKALRMSVWIDVLEGKIARLADPAVKGNSVKSDDLYTRCPL